MEDLSNEWILFLKIGVVSLIFVYTRCTMTMSEITGVELEDCLCVPSLG